MVLSERKNIKSIFFLKTENLKLNIDVIKIGPKNEKICNLGGKQNQVAGTYFESEHI